MREAGGALQRRRRVTAWLARMWLAQVLLLPALWAAEIVIYGFEEHLEGWVIPAWAKTSGDYGGESIAVSQEVAVQGRGALELRATFSGQRWSGAYVEREVETTDWTPFGRLSVDVYLPNQAPKGLAGKIILTIGSQWQWTEMNRSIPLIPGRWTRIEINVKPGSMDWKFFPDEDFRKNVRKIGVRIESNTTPYTGPVFLDNMLLAE